MLLEPLASSVSVLSAVPVSRGPRASVAAASPAGSASNALHSAHRIDARPSVHPTNVFGAFGAPFPPHPPRLQAASAGPSLGAGSLPGPQQALAVPGVWPGCWQGANRL